MKSKYLGILVLLAIIFYVAYQFYGKTYQLVVSKDEIIEKLQQKFPFEKNYFLIFSLKFDSPRLRLTQDSDRIGFGCRVSANISIAGEQSPETEPLSGILFVSGLLRYEPTEGAFFLDQSEVEELELQGLPERFREKINKASKKAISEFLERAPVYSLKDHNLKHLAAKLVLKDVKVENEEILITLGYGD